MTGPTAGSRTKALGPGPPNAADRHPPCKASRSNPCDTGRDVALTGTQVLSQIHLDLWIFDLWIGPLHLIDCPVLPRWLSVDGLGVILPRDCTHVMYPI